MNIKALDAKLAELAEPEKLPLRWWVGPMSYDEALALAKATGADMRGERDVEHP